MSGESYTREPPLPPEREPRPEALKHPGLKGQARLPITRHSLNPPKSTHCSRPSVICTPSPSQSPILWWSHSRADPETPSPFVSSVQSAWPQDCILAAALLSWTGVSQPPPPAWEASDVIPLSIPREKKVILAMPLEEAGGSLALQGSLGPLGQR